MSDQSPQEQPPRDTLWVEQKGVLTIIPGTLIGFILGGPFMWYVLSGVADIAQLSPTAIDRVVGDGGLLISLLLLPIIFVLLRSRRLPGKFFVAGLLIGLCLAGLLEGTCNASLETIH